ncbi:bacteriohemerythrin [Insolitispirillum peregrinum]|uniref:Hemerythrin n=1 Tax=Insolitispirillum peregrinum TaxID=80876 RepID=A0A1N7MNJ3_9PROT|nr:bacteriohemerythrin [Insolitispirillum peregrinum]SIS87602.1 hemerythrin [Insolitispirillum peregrinum]
MLIQWNDAWRVGNSAIDYDHQMLVNITNQLWDIKNNPRVRNAEIARILGQLVEYVKRHFEREEAIFLASDYPHKKEHIAMHRELTKVVEDIGVVFNREPDLLNFDEIMAFLKRWLMDHIVKHDMGYKDYIGEGAKKRRHVA